MRTWKALSEEIGLGKGLYISDLHVRAYPSYSKSIFGLGKGQPFEFDRDGIGPKPVYKVDTWTLLFTSRKGKGVRHGMVFKFVLSDENLQRI